MRYCPIQKRAPQTAFFAVWGALFFAVYTVRRKSPALCLLTKIKAADTAICGFVVEDGGLEPSTSAM